MLFAFCFLLFAFCFSLSPFAFGPFVAQGALTVFVSGPGDFMPVRVPHLSRRLRQVGSIFVAHDAPPQTRMRRNEKRTRNLG